jgi:hypothetical protein
MGLTTAPDATDAAILGAGNLAQFNATLRKAD